jgi:2-methylisocitrate lyase-like PEP mutase family enzyme
VPDIDDKAARFLALHRRGEPLLQPNAWDVGSARLLETLGFLAIATTSGGFAATLGRLDGDVSRHEAIEHGARLAAAVAVPVAADTENGFADDPDGVAETVSAVCDSGLAGCSIEDFTRRRHDPVYELPFAAERVRAAAEAAHRGPNRVVLTARAENHIRGRDELEDTVTRLQAYQEAGADVLFAPGLFDIEDIRTVVDAVDRPVNVLVRPGTPSVAELAEAGVARISVGGGFAYAAYAELVACAAELRAGGSYAFLDRVTAARAVFRDAWSRSGD